jgi:hypothetical protein
MKIKFKCNCQVEIVERIDKNGEPVWGLPETFRKGETTEFDLIDHPERFRYNEKTKNGTLVADKNLWNVQFGNGSMGMALSRSWFTITSKN